MKVNVIYDKYNTVMKKAALEFGDSPETRQDISMEIEQKEIGTEEKPLLQEILKLVSTDSSSIEIVNEMTKEDLRVFHNVIRNLLGQMR